MIEHLKQVHRALGGLSAPVVHVAGTKGKGSTALLLGKILEFHGKKAGVFTSPTLLKDEEMIQVNGQTIPEEKLEEQLSYVRGLGVTLSEFEALTLAALRFFEEEKCDFVVLECGWGGARDATNLLENKVLTILTHVELEHTEVLGRTLSEITREKLGICREGVPLFTVSSQAQEVLEEVGKADVPIQYVPSVQLGFHHPESVGLALEAARFLGFDTPPTLLETLQNFVIPGRFEIIRLGPHTLILDGAHTRDSMNFVLDQVQDFVLKKGLSSPHFGIHILNDKPKDLWKLCPIRSTVWIPLKDPRASKKPWGLYERNIEAIFEELKNEKTPQVWAFIGSFRLVAHLKSFLAASSSKMATPSSLAFSNLLPGSSPTTK